MRNSFHTIFFDLDGTLSDSCEGIENSLRYAFSKLGIKAESPERIRQLIGIPLNISLRTHFFRDDHQTELAVGYFREYYSVKGIFESRLYPGIYEMIHELSGVSRLYIITAKPTAYARTLLDYHGILKYITEVSGCSMNGKNFSKADFIPSISDLSTAIMVGDRDEDIRAGKKAGIQTCGVLYGYGSAAEITAAGPDLVATTVEELKKLLLG